MSADSLWSATKLRAFHACPRRFRYRYVDGMGEAPSDAQRYGTAVHKALEAWLIWHHEGSEARLTAAFAAIQLTDPWEAARARSIVLGYECRWGGVEWRVLAVEVSFAYELDGHVIQGQIDAIIEHIPDLRRYVVEHKNDSRDIGPGGPNWERLTIDVQVSIYVDGATMLGYQIDGVIYDVLGKPKHKPQLATPVDKRSYTKGKGCRKCGGRAGGKKGPAQGDGLYHGPLTETYETTAAAETPLFCLDCKGSGWKDAPRLHADQRDMDESVEAFEERICAAIAAEPDTFYQRAVIVRTEAEIPVMRDDILNTIRLARLAAAVDCWPKNTSACTAFNQLCYFFPKCSGTAEPDDPRFQRRTRPESTAPSQP